MDWGRVSRGLNCWENDRVILLAEAGSGKSTEMHAQKTHLLAQQRFAFFIRLELLYDGLESGFQSMEDERRFNTWKSDGQSPAWFFLDAVDELKLVKFRIDKALRHLSKSIDGHMNRAKIFISCRVSDWRPHHDLNLVRELFPIPKKDDNADISYVNAKPKGDQVDDDAFKTVLMLPMTETQMGSFSAQLGIGSPTEFLEEIKRQHAWMFARRPLDLNTTDRRLEERRDASVRDVSNTR